MPPKRIGRREQSSNSRVASQLARLHSPTVDIPADHIAEDLAAINQVLAQNLSVLAELKQHLIRIGKWPHSANVGNSNRSSYRAAGDSSDSGERPPINQHEQPLQASERQRGNQGRKAFVDQVSDESTNAQEHKASGGSTTAPGGPTAMEVDSSGSSAAGNAGRNKCNSDQDGSDDSDPGLRPPRDLSGGGMDCLPQDALVWVQGQDTPKLTVELQPGDQVCCFDSLGRNTRYAEVTDVRVDDEQVEWVRVELADGTKTVLTMDHPVQLYDNKYVAQEVVKAGDIEPQKSNIMVHRVTTRAVLVSKIIRAPPGLMNPSGRVAITVKQPDRNAILVASPGQGGEVGHGREDVHFVAVGSADLTPKPCGIVRTRIHPAVPLVFPAEVGRRSHSWPPDPVSRLELSLAAPRLQPLQKNQAESSSHSAQDSSTGSYQDSGSETSSGGDTMVLLPWILPKSSPDLSRAPRGVSELLQARASEWPSVGSSGHPDSCRPCAFAHRGRCLAGVWCPKCHGQHRKCNGKLFSVSRPPPPRDRCEDNGQ